LFTFAQWLKGDGVDIKRFPKVADHQRPVLEEPVVVKVLAAQKTAA
jgi:glutathione S-transferase